MATSHAPSTCTPVLKIRRNEVRLTYPTVENSPEEYSNLAYSVSYLTGRHKPESLCHLQGKDGEVTSNVKRNRPLSGKFLMRTALCIQVSLKAESARW